MKEEYSAGGIVFKKDEGKIQILFILDPYGKWAFPKGHIENETSEQAAIREVAEETGIETDKLKVIKKLGSTDFWFSFAKEKIHKFMDLYLMEADKGVSLKPQKNEKIQQAKWVDIDRALEFFAYDNGRDILAKGIKEIKENYGV